MKRNGIQTILMLLFFMICLLPPEAYCETAGSLNQKGNEYFQAGDYETAFDYYTKSIALNSYDPSPYSNRGLVYFKKQDYDRAIEEYNKALELNPSFYHALFNRGLSYAWKGERDKAIADYSKAIELKPDAKDAYLERGFQYNNNGSFAQSIDDFNKAIEIDPTNAYLYHYRGVTYNTSWANKNKNPFYDTSKAIRDFTSSIKLDPKLIMSYLERARIYRFKTKDYNRAINDYSMIIQLEPDNTSAYSQRANCYKSLGNYNMAIGDYNKLIKIKPNEYWYYIQRGDIHKKKKDYNNAINDYSNAIDLKPSYTSAYNKRGSIFLLKGDCKSALNDYEKSIEFSPRGTGYENKAWILATCSDLTYVDSKKAIFFAKKISYKKSSSAIDTLAAAYAENGNFEEAVRLQRQAFSKAEIGKKSIYQKRLQLYQKKISWRDHKLGISKPRQLKITQQIDNSKSKKFAIDTGAYYALLIGNNQYQYLPSLKTARADVESISVLLKKKFDFQTKLLINATRDNILDAINDMRSHISSNDNLLIYYAGHGYFDKQTQKAYWIPVDAKNDNDKNWILADRVTSNIKRFSSNHILIVSDSCYSGTMTRSISIKIRSSSERDKYLRKMMQRNSRTLLASGGNEPVSDTGGGGHSVFAKAFIEGLKLMDTPNFTAEELFYEYVKEAVAGNSDQVPEYSTIRNSGHSGGDFIFKRGN